MEDPDAARTENQEEGPRSLVRPYVVGPVHEVPTPVYDEEPAPTGPGDHSDQADEQITWLPADYLAGLQPPPPRQGKASRLSSSEPAPRRRSLIVFALVTAAVVAGITFLALPSPSGMRADGCGPTGCHRPAPTASSGAMSPPSLAGRVNPTAMPTSHAATPRVAAPAATVSQNAQPTGTPATGTSSTGTPSRPPTSGTPSLQPGSVISIEATTPCCTSFSIAHDDSDDRVVISQITLNSPSASRANATWIVRQGLADSACLSFESANASGEYLRHHDFQLFLDPDDGGSKFAHDATFCPGPGNSGEGYSFESYNDPFMFIRHFNYIVYIASNGGELSWDASTLWHHDTTWQVIQPWS